MIWSAIAVVVTFGLVIFLHEGGHFLVCKKLGVRVERFAFGFGPELFGFTYGETRFSICAIPLGGFVKPAGESIEDATGDPDEYFSRSPWERLAIVAAGPAMNYVLAFFMFFSVVYFRGLPEPTELAIVGETAADFPAAQAGLKAGDKIVEVGGVSIEKWNDMASVIHRHPDTEVALAFERDGSRQTLMIKPRKDAATGKGLIGIVPKIDYVKQTFLSAAAEGAHQCWYWTAYTVKTLKDKIVARERPDLAGPVGIVQMVSKAAHSGIEDFIFLIGLISVAIGFFNLLPIPLLDGGHGVLYLWEGLTKRKLTVNIIAYANSVGLVFLLSLLVFATYNDILRLRDSRRAKKEAKAAAEASQAAPSGSTAPAAAESALPEGKNPDKPYEAPVKTQ